MALIDFILNIIALLLWWNWLAIRFDPLSARTSAASLVGTLRKAGPALPRRWLSLVALFALLLFRGFFYRIFSASVRWTPSLSLEIINLPFRADYLGRMMLYSFLSFGLTLEIGRAHV